jgi:hypothetical protein
MRTPERTSAIKKYFTAFPPKLPSFSSVFKIGIVLFIIGAVIIFYFKNTAVTGILLIASSSGILFFWLKPYLRERKNFLERPSTTDMYQWLINDLHEKIKERASNVLKLNISSLKPENFMIVHYPIFWDEPGIKPDNILRRATGETKQISNTDFENIYLYNAIKVQVIALTKNYISYYSCNYDWISDAIAAESTNEFFYVDITSVKNDFEPINRKLKGEAEPRTLNALVFKVTNMSSDSLTVITKIPQLNYSPKLEVSLEKAIQALRIILRKRRFDEDQEPIIITQKPEEEEDESES